MILQYPSVPVVLTPHPYPEPPPHPRPEKKGSKHYEAYEISSRHLFTIAEALGVVQLWVWKHACAIPP